MKNHFSQILAQKCRLPIWIVILFLMTINSSFAQTNLITNGDFENKTTGWMAWGATLANTTDKHSGTSAAMVSNRKNPWDAIAQNIKSVLVNGDTYTLSAWIKIPKPAANLRATLHLKDGSKDSYLAYLGSSSPVIGSYVFYTETFTVNWTGNLVTADLYFETDAVAGVYSDYLIDDVQLVKSKPVVDVVQKGPGLKDIKSTMLIGGCIGGTKNYFNSEAAKAQVLKDCNTITVTCYPGWGRWDEVKRHVYHVDDFTNKAHEMKKQNLTLTAHMLMGWDQYFPAWFKKNDFPADTLEAIMKSWMDAIIPYKGNDTLVDVWNIVNEAISWDGKGGYWPLNNANFNDACEFQRMGFEPDVSGLTGKEYINAEHPVYIRKSFEYARTLTKKKLELRDSGFEFPDNGAKYNAFYQLAKHLKNMNAPVDVIGFQTHIDIEKNYDWVAYTNNIKRYVKLGYEVNIPEVDIGDVNKNWSEYKAELQKLQYYKLITAAIRGGASELQTWGFIDDNEDWRKGMSAFPYTNHFDIKPAYYGIQEALIDMSSILFWEMDAPEINIMPDVMKYNNFGTLKNMSSPVIATGFKAKALQFDGIDDILSSGKLSTTISEDLSFSCFLKTSSTKTSIIADLAQEGNSGLKIGLNADGKIYLNAEEAGLALDLVDTTVINDNNWHFIAIRRDSTSYQLYVDASAPIATGIGTIQKCDQLTIGAKIDGSSAFEGSIDEVKLFDSSVDEGSFFRSFAPFYPMKLAYTANGLKIRLSWIDKATDEDGFVVERKTANGNWEEYYRLPANAILFVEELKAYNTEYTYRVRSFNKITKSAPSTEVAYVPPNDPNTGFTQSSADLLFSVYPNPVYSSFTMLSSGKIGVRIYDIQGKLRLEKKNCSSSETIDLSGFCKGIYFLQANTNEKNKVVKLVKN